jgi:DNA-binding transcriptional LysR family regulator
MTTMDIDALRALLLVADLKSFTRPAEALGTTQPVVSLRLKRLEGRLGRLAANSKVAFRDCVA